MSEDHSTTASGACEHPLGLFHGGLPPFMIFAQQIGDVSKIVKAYEEELPLDDGMSILNPAAELGVIGLVAYFEAFCKHQFAALLNIYPPLLAAFSEKRPQAAVPLRDLASMHGKLRAKLGFVIAERFDFGSGKLINGLFTDLLLVTPYGTAEVDKMDELLNDRHLLVHHGGIFTLNYARERGLMKTERGGAFFDSVNFTRERYFAWTHFLIGAAKKLTTLTAQALEKHIRENGDRLTYPFDSAKDRLLWEVDNEHKDLWSESTPTSLQL
jgi:hypothetical protein